MTIDEFFDAKSDDQEEIHVNIAFNDGKPQLSVYRTAPNQVLKEETIYELPCAR